MVLGNALMLPHTALAKRNTNRQDSGRLVLVERVNQSHLVRFNKVGH